MHQMLSVGNLSWNIATLLYTFSCFVLEIDLTPEQLVTIKPRNKDARL